jgi:hypothetical protein
MNRTKLIHEVAAVLGELTAARKHPRRAAR